MRIFYCFLLLLFMTGTISTCEKEIPDDICQREGEDEDCDRRCRESYPECTSSTCELRNPGPLLSLFGVRFFVCMCHLPEANCQEGAEELRPSSSEGSVKPPSAFCAGREGLLRCKNKCRQSGDDDGLNARCVKQKGHVFTKKCVCEARRSPTRHISDETGRRLLNQSSVEKSGEIERNEVSDWKEHDLQAVDILCRMEGGDEQCKRHCKKINDLSIGTCSANTSTPRCECSSCVSFLCDFDDGSECGWSNLSTLSNRFNNISIAYKKDRRKIQFPILHQNRYGISKMGPLSYTGLVRSGWMEGPIHFSVDIYPSETVEVRICVGSLYKCQYQTVTEKTWNRVVAKINVLSADGIFLIFFNDSEETKKTIAIDNISLTAGHCDLPF